MVTNPQYLQQYSIQSLERDYKHYYFIIRGEGYKNGEALELTSGEYKLLCMFMENPDVVLSSEQILGRLWDCDEKYIDNKTLTVYIRRLRMKIEDNPAKPRKIVTVRGMGYKWNTVDCE